MKLYGLDDSRQVYKVVQAEVTNKKYEPHLMHLILWGSIG